MILDDDADEKSEIFLVSLSVPGSSSERIVLEPNTTVIEIHDDDGELPAGYLEICTYRMSSPLLHNYSN